MAGADAAMEETAGGGMLSLRGDIRTRPVSYTHLDVYKRQMLHGGLADSALWIAGDDSQARLAQALQALDLLLAGLRRT